MTPRYSIRDFGYPEDNPLHYGIQDTRLKDHHYQDDQYLSSDDDEEEEEEEPLNQKAIALYSFNPENDNELKLIENQTILINYRYGQGWLVAHDPQTGKTGLIPEEYVELYLGDDDDDDEDDEAFYDEQGRTRKEEATPFLPLMLQDHTVEGNESDWVDEEEDVEEKEEGVHSQGQHIAKGV